MAGIRTNDPAASLAEIRELAAKLSSADIEALEKNLSAIAAALGRVRGEGSLPAGTGAASPSMDDVDKVPKGPAVSSDPSAI